MTTTETTTPAEVVYRDPRTLKVHELNGRSDIGDLSDLIRSIAQVGVLQPIVLVPTEEGGEEILVGQRRVAAAIEAGLERVPCIVRPDLAAGVDAATGALSENLRRKALRPSEEARGYQQLAAFGLSASAIAKRTGSKAAQVRDGLAVASSDLALAAGERYEFLSFAQLLVLSEFESDPEAFKELTVTARKDPEYFEHRASQLRQERAYRERLAATTERLGEAGVRVVEEPGYAEHSPMRRLSQLLGADGKELTEKNHASCEGHVATIHSYDPKRVTYWCAEPKRYGHQDRYASTAVPSSSERGEDGKLTEEARAERRRIIANNKAMDAANPVRREFIAKLLARKAAPKGGLRFAVRDLAAHPESLTPLDDALLATFLGSEATGRGPVRTTGPKAVDQAPEARLIHVLLAHVACSIETTWTKEAWRSVDPRKAAWLAFLSDQGYRLAEVEQLVVDDAAADVERRRSRLSVVKSEAAEAAEGTGDAEADEAPSEE